MQFIGAAGAWQRWGSAASCRSLPSMPFPAIAAAAARRPPNHHQQSHSRVPCWASPPPPLPLPSPCSAAGLSTSSFAARAASAAADGSGGAGGGGGGGAAALADWVRRQGGQVSDAVSVEAFGGADGGSGYGLGARAALPAGAQVVYLPTAAHLTYDADSGAALLALIDQVPTELWGAKLALQLLSHRAAGDASPFREYVEALPVGFQGIPAFFAGPEIAALQYPPVTEQVKMRCRWLVGFAGGPLAQRAQQQEQQGAAGDDPFGGADIDANALGWALAAVTSRAFRTRGPQHPAAMLPLIDMANHSFSNNCEIKPVGKTGVAMVTTQEVAAGEPLLLSYGKLSNDYLLMDYGFIVEGNPYDDIKLKFDLSLMDAGRAFAGLPGELSPALWQSAALQELRLAGKGANTEVTLGRAPRVVDPRLLAAMRVLSMADPSELRGRSLDSLGQLDAQGVHPQTEAAALRSLIGVAALVLSQFPTTLDQDVALLLGQQGAAGGDAPAGGADAAGPPSGAPPNKPLSDNARLAVLFRVEKKRVLVEAMQALAERLKEAGGKAASASGGVQPQRSGTSSNSGGGTSSSRASSSSKRKQRDDAPKTKPKKATAKGFG